MDPLADLEADGQTEIVVATALGFVYVLDAATGATRRGFPASLGTVIQGQVIAADLTGDGHLELVRALPARLARHPGLV